MAEITTLRIEAFLQDKARAGMQWATRADLRNLLSGIFSTAKRWGYWKDVNPATEVILGKPRPAREKRKLTDDQTRALLALLPHDVRLICEVALYCTLRISEVLGLQWKHINWLEGTIQVRQRFYRGSIGRTKSERSQRDVSMGPLLTGDIRKIWPGPGREDEFVFSVHTCRGECRDDRSIHQHFLKPAAKKVGCYYKGFGFHAFRREAITGIAREADAFQAMRAAGHSRMDQSLQYALEDRQAQNDAVKRMEQRLKGTVQ